jgi:hypothetical protein
MFCVNCSKLALLMTRRLCIRCQSVVLNNLSILCEYCSNSEKVCSICLKKIKTVEDSNKSRYRGCGNCGR